MQIALALGPLTAQIRLCWTSIRSPPVVQSAADAIIVQITTGGDQFGLDREVSCPVHFAEIRRPAGSHQSLQLALPFGAHDLDLEVSAAGGAPEIVGGPARGQRAGIAAAQDRKSSGRRRQIPNGGASVLYNKESIPAQPSRLVLPAGAPGSGSPKPVRCALGLRTIVAQVSARYVEHGVHVQLASVVPDIVEGDPLRVTDEPGRLVIQRGVPLFERSHSKRDRHRPALAAETATGRHFLLGQRAIRGCRCAHDDPKRREQGNLPKGNLASQRPHSARSPSSVYFSSAYSERVHKQGNSHVTGGRAARCG